MHPHTDIIALVHNKLSVTKQFVDRLFKHTENFRLIFVDNGSSDDTPIYLKENNNRWTVLTHDKNLGVIGGRNSATRLITSDYFLNIDNDQLVTPGWLDLLYECMSKGYDIVGSEAWKLALPGSKGQVVLNGQPGPQDRSYFPYMKCTKRDDSFTYIGCGGMLIKKTVLDDIGLFDDRFSPAYFEDPDFCFRAIQAGYKLGWCPECKIDHLAHQTIGSQNAFNKNAQFFKSWGEFQRKWSPYYPPPMRMSNA